jgi:hypothetical protein
MANMANFIAAIVIPHELNLNKRKKFLKGLRYYVWDDPHPFKI